MRTLLAIATLLLLGSTAVSQDSSFSLSAVVRVDQLPPESLVVTVPAGSVATVDLTNHLRLVFTAPKAKERRTTTQLLRLTGGAAEILHTTRQGGDVGFPRRNGYVVCQGQVRFMSPAPELLPECEG